MGRFHFRTFLGEPPGGEIHEKLDGICPFDVVRTDKNMGFDLRPDSYAYHEDWSWTAGDRHEPPVRFGSHNEVTDRLG